METERKLLKLPLGFRSKIPRRGIHEYQRPENFAKHNALHPQRAHPVKSAPQMKVLCYYLNFENKSACLCIACRM